MRAAAADHGYEVAADAELLDESVLALADVLVDIAESAHRDRPVLERGEALRASPVRAALNELAEQHPSLARARRVVRRLRRLR